MFPEGGRGEGEEGKEAQGRERRAGEKKKKGEKREKKKGRREKKAGLWEEKLFLFIRWRRGSIWRPPIEKKVTDPLVFPNGSETLTPDFQTHGPSPPPIHQLN